MAQTMVRETAEGHKTAISQVQSKLSDTDATLKVSMRAADRIIEKEGLTKAEVRTAVLGAVKFHIHEGVVIWVPTLFEHYKLPKEEMRAMGNEEYDKLIKQSDRGSYVPRYQRLNDIARSCELGERVQHAIVALMLAQQIGFYTGYGDQFKDADQLIKDNNLTKEETRAALFSGLKMLLQKDKAR